MPHRFVDEHKVEKWVPNQTGFSITGNRRQNFSEYRINDFGFNSYHEYKPTKDKIEIALVGDSFIEGFHQNYYNSIGRKIEDKLKDVQVYEYGYAGYDFADQLHLINAYKDHFDLIDYVIIDIKFSTDLSRDNYNVIKDRMRLERPFYKILKKSKLIIYLQSIGVFEPFKDFIFSSKKSDDNNGDKETIEDLDKKDNIRLENFKKLVSLYGYDKSKFVFLLDSNNTSILFLNYLKENNFRYIDVGPTLKKSDKVTTLVYDMHWNNRGRNLVADLIVEYYSNELK
jgi:hypothetical protein